MKEVDKRFELSEDDKTQISRRFGKQLRRVIVDSKRGNEIDKIGRERLFHKLLRGGNPTLHTIYLFAKALGVHPKELFDFDEDERILWREDFKDAASWWEYKEKQVAGKSKR